DAGQLLAVTLALAVAGLVLELHDRDLLAALGTHDLGGDGDLGQVVRTGGHLVAVHEHERGEVDGVPNLAVNLVHDDDVADGHLLLSAAGLDDRVHHVPAHLCRYGASRGGREPTHTRRTRGGTSETHRRSRVRAAPGSGKCLARIGPAEPVCFRAHRPPRLGPTPPA